MGAPHSTGFLCGRKDLVDAAVGHGFISPGKPFGRAMKMDRQEIVGLVTAVSEWFAMDHEERLLIAGGKLGIIQDAVSGLDSVAATAIEASDNYMAIALNVTLDTKALGKDAPGVIEALSSMTPRIRADAAGDRLTAARRPQSHGRRAGDSRRKPSDGPVGIGSYSPTSY